MIQFTEDELDKMSLSTAQNELGNEVYKASQLYESLEYRGKVRGNGHHIRQELVRFAQKLMKDRWVEK